MVAIMDTKDAANSTCTHALDLFCAKSQLRPVILDICARYGARRIVCLGHDSEGLCCALQEAGYAAGREPGGGSMANSMQRAECGYFSTGGRGAGVADRVSADCDVVVSTEMERAFFKPATLVKWAARTLRYEGILLIRVPDEHWGLKQLFFAAMQSLHRHRYPVWDDEHMQCWSLDSLKSLLEYHGFVTLEVIGIRNHLQRQHGTMLVARRITHPGTADYPVS